MKTNKHTLHDNDKRMLEYQKRIESEQIPSKPIFRSEEERAAFELKTRMAIELSNLLDKKRRNELLTHDEELHFQELLEYFNINTI